jgi:arginine-tRNA-protein transferase
MFACEYYPKELAPHELDDFLAKGYFRIGQKIFTTAFISFDRKLFDTIWLRIDLKNATFRRSQLELLNKSKLFRFEVKQVKVSKKIESLYQKYILSRPFIGSSSVASLLFEGGDPHTCFNTKQLEIYDDKKLVGCGIYDIGHKAAEGICSFYDPEYDKYSMGKLIILKKMMHCIEQDLDYFYPGYFVPKYAAFDYKLSLARKGLEYFNPVNKCWYDISLWDDSKSELRHMSNKLVDLQEKLKHTNTFNIYMYLHFYWCVIPTSPNYLSFPLILVIKQRHKPRGVEAVVFNTRTNEFQIVLLVSKPAFQYVYGELLYVHKEILSTSDENKIAQYILSRTQ